MDHIYLVNNDTKKFERVPYDKKRSHEIITQLYFLKYRLPIPKEIQLSKNDNVKKYYGKYSIDSVKKNISNINDNIPMFNIYHVNIYLIRKENVYYRSVYGTYRFPGESVLKYFDKYIDDHKDRITSKDMVTKRKFRKITLMRGLIKQLDMDTLYDSYIRVFVKYSPQIGNLITECSKPSFINAFDHLSPYYTRKELINMALNMELNVKFDIYDPDNIQKICDKVSKNDINSKILVNHQDYIFKKNGVGLIKYYTIQGSYFMNQYMRHMTTYGTKNKFMEKNIQKVWELILGSPEFDNDYYVYRFIEDDHFLKNIKIGEYYKEPGFMSTTRDPFYRSDIYKFGFILLKIKIPKGKKGVALCLETLSQFPSEQEIILPPLSKFKLINKNKNCTYHHTDSNYTQKVRVRYEFEWESNENISFTRPYIEDEESRQIIDFTQIIDNTTLSLKEKSNVFAQKYMNERNSFDTNIGKQKFQLIGEWYNSTGAYKSFYALEVADGFSIYTIFEGNVLFMLELADANDSKIMMVNYYLRYTNVDRSKIFSDEEFILFLCKVAHYFDIPNIIIYSDFISCDIRDIDHVKATNTIQRSFSKNDYSIPQHGGDKSIKSITKSGSDASNINGIHYGGYHSLDVFNYLKHGIKRFGTLNSNTSELNSLFSYEELDKLKLTSPLKILNKEDNDELYQIYLRNYYPTINTTNKITKNIKGNTLSDFYLWIVDNYGYLITKLIEKMDRLYTMDNPFENIMYSLVPDIFLYNRGIVSYVRESMILSYPIKKVYKSEINFYRETVSNAKKLNLIK